MTNGSPSPDPDDSAARQEKHNDVDHLDLTPEGLADAPAKEEDRDSIVHPGNS